MGKDYSYETCCVHSTARLIQDMVDQAIEITWATFRKYVDWEEVREVFPDYSYRREKISPIDDKPTVPMHIKDDYAVSFHRSKYKGKRCYYIRHSGIEYIFTRG